MADTQYFRIPLGEIASLGLALVDRAAPGYTDAWQAPGGATLPDVTVADYDAFSASWACQVSTEGLNFTSNVNTTDRKGTLCKPPSQSVTVGEDSIVLALGYFQDPHIADGFSAFLYEHSTREAYFYFGADGDNPPRAIGRCRLVSGSIGGDTHTDLEATVEFPVLRRPDIEFGNATTSRIVLGGGEVAAASGATAGTPGTWTPAGSTPPANAAGATSAGITASPATAWTTGQYVQGSTAGTPGEMHWSGTAWATGKAT